MRVTVTPTVRSTTRWLSRYRRNHWWLLALGGLLVVTWLAVSLQETDRGILRALASTTPAVVILGMAWYFLIGPTARARRLVRIGPGDNAITYALAPDGVRIASSTQEVFLRWASLAEPAPMGDFLPFIRADGCVVGVVPKTAFAASQEFDAFLAEARRLWQAAKSAAAPPTPGRTTEFTEPTERRRRVQ